MGLRSVFSGAESEVGWPDRRRGRGKRETKSRSFYGLQTPSQILSSQSEPTHPYLTLTFSNIIFKISVGTHIPMASRPRSKLTEAQATFVDHKMLGLNDKQAAVAAGQPNASGFVHSSTVKEQLAAARKA